MLTLDEVLQRSSILAPRLLPLADRIGPPPEGIAPLDQFREALLLTAEANGRPPNATTLQRSNAELLQLYQHEHGGGYHEQRIRAMVEFGGYAEAEAVAVQFGLSLVFGAWWIPNYARPPNTQLTLEEVLSPPWTATYRRWHRYKNENGTAFVDRS
jgi:hypothetical protein